MRRTRWLMLHRKYALGKPDLNQTEAVVSEKAFKVATLTFLGLTTTPKKYINKQNETHMLVVYF